MSEQAPLDETEHEHDPELEAFRLVHREYRHRVPIPIGVVRIGFLAGIEDRP